MKFYLALGACAVIALGLWHYKHTMDENARLARELGTANAAVYALDKAAEAHGRIFLEERNAIDEIDAAPASDDGPIAPVLRRAIDSL